MKNINWAKFGHTYEDHIAVEVEDLIERLVLGKYDAGVYDSDTKSAIASRFLNEEIAFKSIKAALKNKKAVIQEWMTLQYEQRLVLHIDFLQQIGEGVAKNTNWNTIYPMYSMVIVLEADCHFRTYHFVTAYPTANKAIYAKIQFDRRQWFTKKKRQ